MTRKDFVLVAATLNAARTRRLGDAEARDAIERTALDLADQFGVEYSAFDRDRFLAAVIA